MEGMNWRKSSYSGNSGGNCTEVATVPGAVLVRDSKDPRGPVLAFGRKAWATFAVAVKTDTHSDEVPGELVQFPVKFSAGFPIGRFSGGVTVCVRRSSRWARAVFLWYVS